MKAKFFLGFLFLALSFQANAQTLDSTVTAQNQKPIAEKSEPADKKVLSTDSSDTSQSSSQTQQQPYIRPDSKTRFRRYWQSNIGPSALAGAVFSAGFSTWRNNPEEWGKKWDGFGKRVASNFGRNAIRTTTTYALSEAFKLDSHYYRSQNRSTGARIKNAVISPFTARNTEGKRVFGFPNLVGVYGANIVAAEAWIPNRDYKDGLRGGTISLGTNILFNLVREFIRK